MNKKAKSGNVITGIFVGVVVGLLVLIFGQPIKEHMNPPKPIWLTQTGSPEVCPSGIYFNTGETASFGIGYKNTGNSDALFTAEISSSDVQSKYTGTKDDFNKISSKSWIVESGQPVTYEFTLKRNMSMDLKNITLLTKLRCRYDTSLQKGVDCGIIQRCCSYNKTRYDYNYEFIEEGCR